MSSNARWQASRLREKYALVFGLPLDEVEITDDGYYDRYFVLAPKHPEFPRWDTGDCL
jgi:hypothetical protein